MMEMIKNGGDTSGSPTSNTYAGASSSGAAGNGKATGGEVGVEQRGAAGESKAGTAAGEDEVLQMTGKRKLSDTDAESPVGAVHVHTTPAGAPHQLPPGPPQGSGGPGAGLNANANASGGLLSGITGAAGATAQRPAPSVAAASAVAVAVSSSSAYAYASDSAYASASASNPYSTSASNLYSTSVLPYTTMQNSGAAATAYAEGMDPATIRAMQVPHSPILQYNRVLHPYSPTSSIRALQVRPPGR